MNDFSWYRLTIRLFGLLIIAIWLPSLAMGCVTLLIALIEHMRGNEAAFGPNYTIGDVLLMHGRSLVPQVVTTGVGVYMLLGAPGFVRWSLRGVNSTCASCGYNLQGTTSPRCPECGSPTPAIQRAAALDSKPNADATAPSSTPPGGDTR